MFKDFRYIEHILSQHFHLTSNFTAKHPWIMKKAIFVKEK